MNFLVNSFKLNSSIHKRIAANVLRLTSLSYDKVSKGQRSYISEAYKCEEKWNYRFQDPMIKDIKPVDYYYELVKKYRKEGKVSAIDVDIFLNSIKKEYLADLSGEVEEIVRLLRRSTETIHTLPSSIHTLVRLHFEAGDYDQIFKFLSDPLSYGVFLDFYLCDWMMASFLKQEKYMSAARTASTLMLQEDYGSDLTKSLCMMACLKYLLNGDENETWVDYNPHVEPEEEVKVLVRYIRNPYFDDHFDLKDPIHIVGKTMAWLTFHLEDELLKANAAVLGWSMYEKWEELIVALEKLLDSPTDVTINENIISKVNEVVSAKCQDENLRSKITSLIARLGSTERVTTNSIVEKVEKRILENFDKFEEASIKNQEAAYDSWLERRSVEVEKQLQLYEKRRLMQEIQQKKEDLQNREDVIFFFENQNKFEMYEPPEESDSGRKKSETSKDKSDADEEYVPPEV